LKIDLEVKGESLSGFSWNALSAASDSLLRLAVGIIVVRLVPPGDFGTMSTALVLVGLASFFISVGMGAAIIQRKDLQEAHIRVAITLSLISGLLVYATMWLLSPIAAGLFHDEKLSSVIRTLSIQFFCYGPYLISRSLLVRRFDFKTLFYIDLFSFLFGYGALTIYLAIRGFGLWSLVAGTVAMNLIAAFATIYYVGLSFRPLLQWEKARSLLSFGGGVGISNLLGLLNARIDYLIIARYLTPADLGFYSKALELVKFPLLKLSQVVFMPLFSCCAKNQDDQTKLKELYLRTMELTALFGLPILSTMTVGGYYFVTGLYGRNWQGSIASFQILAFAGIFMVASNVTAPVIRALGKVYVEANRQLSYIIVFLAAVMLGIRYGIEGVAVAVVIRAMWSYLTMTHITNRMLKVRWGAFLKVQIPGVVMSAAVGSLNIILILLMEFLWKDWPVAVKLIILIGFSGTTFLGVFIALPASLRGATIAWLLTEYYGKIPHFLKAFVHKRFKVVDPQADTRLCSDMSAERL